MNTVLRLNEGLVDLSSFDAVRVMERGGVRVLVGEHTGNLVEHVLAYFDAQHPTEPDKSLALLDRLADAVVADARMIDCRDLTIQPTDQMQANIAMSGGGDEADPKEMASAKPELPRVVFRLKRGDSMPKELQMLKGRRVTGIEMSGDLVGLICEAE